MTPARILAPAALVAAAIALFAILASGGGEPAEPEAAPAATATATKTARPRRSARPSGGTYTVEPGDTPSGIAEKEDVDVDELLELNPDVDPDALTVGDELKLP